MSFLNSYISIFNYKRKSKLFVKLISITIFILLIFSYILHILDFRITDNDVIKKYQLSKIDSKEFSDINTIFVGDSSSGNSLNSLYFDNLTGLKSQNLSLTGSWGLVGSLGMIKKALEKNKNIKNIIIVQTLDIWKRDFSKESILELFEINQQFQILDINSIIGYNFNLKEIKWHLSHFFRFIKLHKIDFEHDYIYQKEKKYSNSMLQVKEKDIFDDISISKGKIIELEILDDYCKNNSLNCIFMNGPIHNKTIKNPKSLLSYLSSKVKKRFKYIKYYKNIFSYEGFKIGDSLDHIDIKYKNESTLDYFNLIKNDLIY